MQAVCFRRAVIAPLVALWALTAVGEERNAAPPPARATAPDSTQKLAEQAAAARRIIAEWKPPAPVAADPVILDAMMLPGKMVLIKNQRALRLRTSASSTAIKSSVWSSHSVVSQLNRLLAWSIKPTARFCRFRGVFGSRIRRKLLRSN